MTKTLQLHGIVEKNVAQNDTVPAHRIILFDAFDAVISDYKLGTDTAETPPDLLAAAAMRHHHILLAYCEDYALLPMRFGAVFSSVDALGEAMRAHKATYVDALRILSDHREYSIEIIADALPVAPLNTSPTGRGFLNTRMQLRDKRRCLSQDRQKFAQNLQARFSTMAAQPLCSGAPNPDKLLTLTGLLAPSAVRDLGGLALEVQDEAATLGVTLRIKGPWPAYHFVTPQSEPLDQCHGT